MSENDETSEEVAAVSGFSARLGRVNKGLVHSFAECAICGPLEGDWRTAQARAQRHHKKTGHATSGENGYVFRYDA